MVTGSVGCMLHGEPRATYDIGIVIDPTPEQRSAMLEALDRDWIVFADAAREALRNRSMFNVINQAGAEKVDFIIRRDREYSKMEFSRRVSATLLGTEISVVSPEDSILSKLEWAKKGDSERQFRDAVGVAVTQTGRLDFDYMRRWAGTLGLSDELSRLLRRTSEMGEDRGGGTPHDAGNPKL